MPPYSAVKSKAQSRLLFAKARQGEGISLADARGKTRAANFKALPERKAAPSGKRRVGRRAPRRRSR